MQFTNIEEDVHGQQKVGKQWQYEGSQGDAHADEEHDEMPVLHAMKLGQIADDHREGATNAAGEGDKVKDKPEANCMHTHNSPSKNLHTISWREF